MKMILTNSNKKQSFLTIGKRYASCLIAPAAAAVLLLVVYYVFDLFPFTRNLFAWGDMTQQSIPLLLDFKNILSGDFDLFLNTANAGGMSFWGVFLFFLSSPFSFLTVFVDSGDMYLFANILVLLKMATAAFTASLFFRRQFPKLTIFQHNGLAMLYAFCGYSMFYYQNLVWLDMLYVFPLLLMGLSQLLEKQKIGLYVIALTATVAVNYYLSYMVIIFLVLAMGVYTFVAATRENRKKNVALFGVASLIAALMTAVFWLPSFFQYTHSGRTTDLFTSLARSDFFTSIPTVYPVILCTAATMAIIPMFFLAKLYRSRKAVALFVTYVLTLIPVVLEPINKMWHTGSYQAFPVRYGYIPVLLALCLTAIFITQSNEVYRLTNPTLKTPVSMGMITGFLLASQGCVCILMLVEKFDELSHYVGKLWSDYESFCYFLLFAGLAALIYFLFFLLYHNQMFSRRVFSIALCFLVVCEGFFYSSVYIGAASRNAWTYDSAMELDHKIDNADLFRTKLNRKYFDVNLVGALGYNTMAHYTSLTDEDFMFAMKKLGYSSYWMEVGSNGGTLLTDMLLANRYVILKNTDAVPESMEKLYEELVYCIVENPAVTSFGTTFSTNAIQSLETLPVMSRMELQQYLSDLFYDCGDVVQSYTPNKKINVRHTLQNDRHQISLFNADNSGYLYYKIQVKGTQTLYLDCFDKTSTALKESVNDSFDVTVNGIRKETGYPTQRNNGLLDLGTFTDETVEVELKVKKQVNARSFGVFGVKETVLTKANQEKTPTTLTRNGNTISGAATAQTDGEYLFLPISWDSGYTAAVNGEEAEIYRVFDAFMAVKLDAGENTVSLTYVPRGFKSGLVLSLIGAAVFAFALWAMRQKWMQRLRWLYLPIFVLFILLVVVVFFMIYIFPLLFCGIPG